MRRPFEMEAPCDPALGNVAREIEEDYVRRVLAAFAAGADYVSLTSGGREIGRIYRDCRGELHTFHVEPGQ